MSLVNGVIPATVTDNHDPEGRGRVQIEFTHIEGLTKTFARIATMMSGGDRGTWFMPEVGDEVLVAFAYGDVAHPYIVGFLWNDSARPPSTDPQQRLIRSVNKHQIEIYDPNVAGGDMGLIRLKDAHGNVIELSNAQLRISGVGTVIIEAPNVLINGRPVLPGAGTI